MSTVQNSLWTKLPAETLDSKYEKCRNITEEIYKRINITFQIKKLETNIQSDLSDNSDQIDSNELSNETDLFACDKSSISSSTELEALEQGSAACEKFINNNNNEEKIKKATVVCKRPRKRFRKRVKKQQTSKKDSDGSSDEAIPLSRVAVVDNRAAKSPLHSFMGLPNVVITLIDLKKLKLPIPDVTTTKKSEPKQTQKAKGESPKEKVIDKTVDIKKSLAAHKSVDKTIELKKGVEKPDTCQTRDKSLKEKSPSELNCTLCSLSFKGERGLRRHMTMSHIISPDEEKKSNKAREET